MATLSTLLNNVRITASRGDMTTSVTNVVFDSRKITDGCLFVAIKGKTSDGHQFISNAIAAGAAAIVCENDPDQQTNVPWITVRNSSHASEKLHQTFTIILHEN